MERGIIREKFASEKDFFERIKIGVVPICRGAGATLIATSLARILSENEKNRISFIEILKTRELGGRLTFDSLGIDRRFAGRKFTDVFQLTLQGVNTRGITNIDDGINWILHTPKTNPPLKILEEDKTVMGSLDNLRVINNAPGDIIVCDFEIHREFRELLTDMDVLIVVIDPMPSSLIAGFEILGYCKLIEEKGGKIFWIINKDNGGVNKRELHKFIKLKELHYIPFINSQELYSAEYNCLLPISNREVRSILHNPLNKIIKSIFG